MSDHTVEQLILYISAHHGNKKVYFSWFGGEPTLGAKRISQICNQLKQQGINFVSDMTSNAYLFDEQLAAIAKKDWNLTRIQITLDGTEDIYKTVKSYVGISDNPYQRVLRNINLLLQQNIAVNIRLNFDKHNADDLKLLIDELTDNFQGKDQLHIYIAQLDEGVGYTPVHHTNGERTTLELQFAQLQDYLESKGWPQLWGTELPQLSLYTCMADNPHYIQCTPNGILSKCEDQIFTHTIGTLEKGIVSKDVVAWWQEQTLYDTCTTCPLFPSCTMLLKNCPTLKNQCYENRKVRRIAHAYDQMRELYLKIKNSDASVSLRQEK